jgi:hypothetical protein
LVADLSPLVIIFGNECSKFRHFPKRMIFRSFLLEKPAKPARFGIKSDPFTSVSALPAQFGRPCEDAPSRNKSKSFLDHCAGAN